MGWLITDNEADFEESVRGLLKEIFLNVTTGNEKALTPQ
jgi:hypothetical protein